MYSNDLALKPKFLPIHLSLLFQIVKGAHISMEFLKPLTLSMTKLREFFPLWDFPRFIQENKLVQAQIKLFGSFELKNWF